MKYQKANRHYDYLEPKGFNNRKPILWGGFLMVFFALQEIFGTLRAFDIFESPFITHVIPTVILVMLILALLYQIHIDKFARKK